MMFCCVTLRRTVPELQPNEDLFYLLLTPLAACVCGQQRRAAAKCVFSTFLCFKKFSIRHVTYQNSAFFKLYTMVQVSALIGSKKMCPKIGLLGMYEIFRKNGGHCTRNFWPQGPVPRKNQVWKMCTKSWNFENFFLKLVSYVPNIILFHYGKYGPTSRISMCVVHFLLTVVLYSNLVSF